MGEDGQLEGAAELVRSADAFLFAAGAGMGVDAGLATYRGPERFEHPVYRRIGARYETLASRQAGFDGTRIVEVHGSLENMQCTRWCGVGLVAPDRVPVPVDPETLEATALPECPSCRAPLRPNVCLFADGDWDDAEEVRAYTALEDWVDALVARLAIIECGAGTTVPTVRAFTERIDGMLGGGRLVRINRHEPSVPSGSFGIAFGCREGLEALDARVSRS